MTIREVGTEEYNGPDFAIIKALGPTEWEVKSRLTGKRVGVYPTSDSAKRIAKNFDDLALRDYLKEQKKKRKKEQSGKYAKDKLTRSEVEKIDKLLSPKIKKHTKLFQLCGSYRRGKQEIGDIDYVVTNCNLENVLAEIQTYFKTLEVSRQGESVMTVVIMAGEGRGRTKEAQVEFLNVPKNEFGSALIHSTGSGEFNQGIRGYAKSKGLLLNQHGLFIASNKKRLASETEDKVFFELGMFTVPPERRSDPWPKLKKEFMRDLVRNNFNIKPMEDEGKTWVVKSKRDPMKKYIVTKFKDGRWTCTCPHFMFRKVECKHIVFVKKK